MKASVEEEIERILPYVPTTPPEDTLEIIQARGYLRDERLLYGCEWVYDEHEGKKVRMVKVVCTKCGGEAYLPYVENGCGRYGATWGFTDPAGDAVTDHGSCLCPCCLTGMTAMHRPSKNSYGEINDHIFMSVHNVMGHTVLLSWLIVKHVRRDGTVFYKSYMYEGAAIIDKTIVRLKGYYQFMSSRTWLHHWEYTKRFDFQFGAYSNDEVICAEYADTDGTECEKSALVGYLKAEGALYPTEYLKVWLKHPNVENLITAGYEDILQSTIHNATGCFKSYYRENFEIKKVEAVLQLKKVRPIDILGIDPEDVLIAKSGGIERLQFYKQIKKCYGVKLNEEQLAICKDQVFMNINELISLAKGYGHDMHVVRLINYLKAQGDAQKEHYDKSLVKASYMTDYLKMLYKVYNCLPKELIYPKDLKKAHDEIQERVSEIENAAVDKAIKARAADLARFIFIDEDSGLMIRPAGSHKEFVTEGKKLNHCVARYAEDHSRGITNIFFIRHTAEPDKPYFTLELDRELKTVKQNRGKSNCARTAEVEAFEAAWMEHVRAVLKKENKKRKAECAEVARVGA